MRKIGGAEDEGPSTGGAPAVMHQTQTNWRFCEKCTAMFFDGRSNKGMCPAGGGHVAEGFVFVLPFGMLAAGNTQTNWRFCEKCTAMFFDGGSNKGMCPAGGGHVAQGFVFVLPFGMPEAGNTQTNWRFCEKCAAMFFDGRSNKGMCPAGGGHVAQGFVFVLPFAISSNSPNLGDEGGDDYTEPDYPPDPPPEQGPTTSPDHQLPCFIGGTQVWMASGATMPIDSLDVGDRVLARDENTGICAVCSIARVFRHSVVETLLLDLSEGERIETTADHQFATIGRGFVRAAELRVGERLSTRDAKEATVVGTQSRVAPAEVYNLSVQGLQTYFIGRSALWVHNAKKADPTEPPPKGEP